MDAQVPPVLLETWLRHEVALRAFGRVAESLKAAGVPVIPVKGLALAHWLYEDVAQRPFTDIDLLIPRAAWHEARRAMIALGEPTYESFELGELSVPVDGVLVELHAEFGEIRMTAISVDDVLARSTSDSATFGFAVRRLDDVDHLLLMAVNALKDAFVFARPHVAGDLARLLDRTFEQRGELVRRAGDAGFASGLYCTAQWMAQEHGSPSWVRLLDSLGSPSRPLFVRAFERFRRLRNPPLYLGVLLGRWSNDRAETRLRAAGGIVWRKLLKLADRTQHA
jgi:hypothetical protein